MNTLFVAQPELQDITATDQDSANEVEDGLIDNMNHYHLRAEAELAQGWPNIGLSTGLELKLLQG